MSKQRQIRASPEHVRNRFAARMWLTEAIERAIRDGLDIAPALQLLEALENLDRVEIIENYGELTERVVAETMVGPAHVSLQDGQVMRLAGKSSPILAMPETSDVIVSGPKGGRSRTPAEEGRIAYACAAIKTFEKLGISRRKATEMVENHLGPTRSDLKKLESGRMPRSLWEEYEAQVARMQKFNIGILVKELERSAAISPRKN